MKEILNIFTQRTADFGLSKIVFVPINLNDEEEEILNLVLKNFGMTAPKLSSYDLEEGYCYQYDEDFLRKVIFVIVSGRKNESPYHLFYRNLFKALIECYKSNAGEEVWIPLKFTTLLSNSENTSIITHVLLEFYSHNQQLFPKRLNLLLPPDMSSTDRKQLEYSLKQLRTAKPDKIEVHKLNRNRPKNKGQVINKLKRVIGTEISQEVHFYWLNIFKKYRLGTKFPVSDTSYSKRELAEGDYLLLNLKAKSGKQWLYGIGKVLKSNIGKNLIEVCYIMDLKMPSSWLVTLDISLYHFMKDERGLAVIWHLSELLTICLINIGLCKNLEEIKTELNSGLLSDIKNRKDNITWWCCLYDEAETHFEVGDTVCLEHFGQKINQGQLVLIVNQVSETIIGIGEVEYADRGDEEMDDFIDKIKYDYQDVLVGVVVRYILRKPLRCTTVESFYKIPNYEHGYSGFETTDYEVLYQILTVDLGLKSWSEITALPNLKNNELLRENGFPKKVFISYAYDDYIVMKQLKGLLLSNKVKTSCFPKVEPNPKRAVSDEIVKKILAADGLVCIGDGKSRESIWVNFERDYALRAGKKVYTYKNTTKQIEEHHATTSPLNVELVVSKDGLKYASRLITWMKNKRSLQFSKAPTILKIKEVPDFVAHLLQSGNVVIWLMDSYIQGILRYALDIPIELLQGELDYVSEGLLSGYHKWLSHKSIYVRMDPNYKSPFKGYSHEEQQLYAETTPGSRETSHGIDLVSQKDKSKIDWNKADEIVVRTILGSQQRENPFR